MRILSVIHRDKPSNNDSMQAATRGWRRYCQTVVKRPRTRVGTGHRVARMDELPGGIRRVTMPLPTRPGHVHCVPAPRSTTAGCSSTPGSACPDARERWAAELARARRRRSDAIFVTHFHPDHVGAARRRRRADRRAGRCRGALDYAQCERVWGGDGLVRACSPTGSAVTACPTDVTEELIEQGASTGRSSASPATPTLVDAGDSVDGWEVVAAPGPRRRPADAAHGRRARSPADHLLDADHADGRALAGEPARSARRLPRLAASGRSSSRPRSRYRGHGEPIDDPVGRARELDRAPRRAARPTAAALGARAAQRATRSRSRSSATISTPAARRFAVAETLSHLERLVREGGPSGTSRSRTGTSPASPILPPQ